MGLIGAMFTLTRVWGSSTTKIIEDKNLVIYEEIVVDIRLPRRGIVIHRRATIPVPDPVFYQINVLGQMTICAHPATIKELLRQIQAKYQKEADRLATMALLGERW